MRQGQLVYVMGASGSGKDSLLQALRPRLRGVPVAFARRYITRPLSAKRMSGMFFDFKRCGNLVP